MAKTNAERQAAHRKRNEVLMGQIEHLKSAFADACERGRSAKVTNRLPDAPQQWVPELIARLECMSLVAHDRGAKRNPKPSLVGRYVRAMRLNPSGTGTLTIYDTHCAESLFSSREGRWRVCCDRHGCNLAVSQLTAARKLLRNPTFCGICSGREMPYEGEGEDGGE